MPMQPIRVRRYAEPADFAGWIEPEDRSWVLFVPADGGAPSLFVREQPQQQASALPVDGPAVVAFTDSDERYVLRPQG